MRFLLDKTVKIVYNCFMLLIAVILMFVASASLSVALCFVNEKKFSTPINLLHFISIVCLGLTAITYSNAFNGYSILLILSVMPLFFTVFDFKFEIKPNNIDREIQSQKTFDLGKIIESLAYLLSAFCIAFCSLYLGKESPFGFMAGIALGFALTFLHFIIKKQSMTTNLFDFLQKLFTFIGVGLLLGAIITTLLYSVALTNILFSISCLLYATYIVLNIYIPNKYNHVVMTVALMILFVGLVF